ncbi:hypothetical protein HY025_01000 [Candidatus Daviesbacteria bacterium]|nr:hypothetical protein [Candidatus Daviesbacteria bacterium]
MSPERKPKKGFFGKKFELPDEAWGGDLSPGVGEHATEMPSYRGDLEADSLYYALQAGLVEEALKRDQVIGARLFGNKKTLIFGSLAAVGLVAGGVLLYKNRDEAIEILRKAGRAMKPKDKP